MTDRRGRRRRHKRHKARKSIVRLWCTELLGLEFETMCKFEASSAPRGSYIDLEGNLSMAPESYVTVARWSPGPGAYSRDWKPPPVKTTTYRLVRRAEGRLFYNGRNRRYRNLPAVLEEVK